MQSEIPRCIETLDGEPTEIALVARAVYRFIHTASWHTAWYLTSESTGIGPTCRERSLLQEAEIRYSGAGELPSKLTTLWAPLTRSSLVDR